MLVDIDFRSQKLCILQHLLIPRIHWPLLIYEVSICLASRLEQTVSAFIRKWLHLLKSLTSILKASKFSGHLLLRDSKDNVISSCKPKLKSGSWKVEETVRSAEAEFRFKELRGATQFGIAGLGLPMSSPTPKVKHYREYRKLVSTTSREIEEEANICKALQLKVQGQWTRWENCVKNDLSQISILAMPPNLLSFCLSSTYDVLPSPRNLRCWGICSEASCFLCQKEVCTTAHILCACKKALSQGRFTFRHGSVKPRLINACGSLNCSFIMTYVKLTTFIILWNK